VGGYQKRVKVLVHLVLVRNAVGGVVGVRDPRWVVAEGSLQLELRYMDKAHYSLNRMSTLIATEEAPIWGMLHLKYQERFRAPPDLPWIHSTPRC
jgi:hypothetical protein